MPNSENRGTSARIENPRVVSSILTLDTTKKRLDPLITERRAGTDEDGAQTAGGRHSQLQAAESGFSDEEASLLLRCGQVIQALLRRAQRWGDAYPLDILHQVRRTVDRSAEAAFALAVVSARLTQVECRLALRRLLAAIAEGADDTVVVAERAWFPSDRQRHALPTGERIMRSLWGAAGQAVADVASIRSGAAQCVRSKEVYTSKDAGRVAGIADLGVRSDVKRVRLANARAVALIDAAKYARSGRGSAGGLSVAFTSGWNGADEYPSAIIGE